MKLVLRINQQLSNYNVVTLSDGDSLDGQDIKDLDYHQATAKGVSITGSRLERVQLAEGNIPNLNLTDVVLKDCQTYGSDLDDARWRRVEVTGGIHSGIALTRTRLQEVVFSGLKANLANFRAAHLYKVEFTDCNLIEADFNGASLHGVRFIRCDLTRASFDGATFKDVSFPGSNLADLRGVTSLKGATIDAGQLMALAPVLALSIGIKIEK